MITFEPIGYIRSPYRDHKGTPNNYTSAGNTIGVIEIEDKYTEGMCDMHAGEKYVVVFYLNKVDGYSLKVHKYGTGPVTGVFSTRSPFRPNPIGISEITIQAIDGNNITFTGVDMFDGTPVLDIKPAILS